MPRFKIEVKIGNAEIKGDVEDVAELLNKLEKPTDIRRVVDEVVFLQKKSAIFNKDKTKEEYEKTIKALQEQTDRLIQRISDLEVENYELQKTKKCEVYYIEGNGVRIFRT